MSEDEDFGRFVDRVISSLQKTSTPDIVVHCSFCEKSSEAVEKIAAGGKLFICNECTSGFAASFVRHEEIYCGFCGKSGAEVDEKIFGGPRNYICIECLELAVDVILV